MSRIEIDPRVVAGVLEDNLRRYSAELGASEVGRVLEAGDGMRW